MEFLVECVPNFSEGRNRQTIRALVDAIRAVPDVFLIDEEMDQDHHRSVLTFVGVPDAVAEAAFQATRVATDLIDLRTHQGGHPRVGATDVVPFVPIRGATMDDCVALAGRVGERIGRELSIPIYLYERAARQPERVNLEVIRKGGLEGLAGRMESDAAWSPDFGPPHLHRTAGATIVGARPPLIAYNVNLLTDDLAVAKAIAKTIRFSSGGLPYVKAIGVELTSRRLVQVSMNLTNFEETPIHVAYEAVAREAASHGVEIAGSEVIGLVPQRALTQVSEHFLKLERFDPTQVLETRLELVLAHESKEHRGRDEKNAASSPQGLDASVSSFLEAVAAGTPTPGGGSVAAFAGAAAAALGIMACRIGPPSGSQKPAPPASNELNEVEQRLLMLKSKLQRLIQSDAEAYAGVVRAYRLSKEDPSRPAAITEKLVNATEVPLETATLGAEAASLLRTLIPLTKSSVASDLKVGVLMTLAAIEGGLENVKTNLISLKNPELIAKYGSRLKTIEESLVQLRRLC